MLRWLVLAVLVLGVRVRADEAGRERLEWLRERLPKSEQFEQWLAETGYLPPDWEKLQPSAEPQDVLVRRDGQRVDAAGWQRRRAELKQDVEAWLLGNAPDAPGNVRGMVREKKVENGVETLEVGLEFGPDHRANLDLTVMRPMRRAARLPVFLVDNVRYTSFARHALEQGKFAICIYHATDPAYRADKKDPSEAFKGLFGQYDWSEFRRRGWSASRAVDWLLSQEWVDGQKIFIGGHSRSAKQSLAAAAFDERIAGVIASSPGSGGSLHYRYCDQYYYGESAERLTTHFPLWVSPKVRFFSGRENRLPADSHYLYALIAPRPVLMSTALHDGVENTFAVERMYESVQPVYQLLDMKKNLVVRYREGGHRPDTATEVAHSEFLMLAAEGKDLEQRFPYRPIHVWDYEEWAKGGARQPNLAAMPLGGASHLIEREAIEEWKKEGSVAERWEAARKAIAALTEKMLGDGPAYKAATVELGAGESEEQAKLLNRGNMKRKVRFSGINANVYWPAGMKEGEKRPVVIWLAPLHTSTGYVPSYKVGQAPHVTLSQRGFVVLAFDPIGTGSRQDERRVFFETHPRWSLMGKMVLDARHAIDAARNLPEVDGEQVYVVGFGMGGMVGVLTAAVDERVAAIVSVSGFSPLRSQRSAAAAGGVRRYSHVVGWLPSLGAFVEHEQRIPIDFPEILAAIAPRRVLVVAPQWDWHHPHEEVAAAVNTARRVHEAVGRPQGLEMLSPDHWVEFNDVLQESVAAWLKPPKQQNN